MIKVKNLTKSYGKFTAVNDISFEVNKGEIVGFLGVNGAGKTTTMRMLTGILRPSQGSIEIDSFDIVKNPVEAKSITGYIPDRPYLYPKLTGREFLEFCADLYSVKKNIAHERIDKLLTEYGLSQWHSDLIESYSHGMKQRLATCAALVHKPKVMIIDEPIVGLDPHGAKLLKDSLRRYAEKGMSIMLSTHSLNVAEEVADRIIIINKGEILTVGTVDNLKDQMNAKDKNLEHIFIELTHENTYETRRQ